jgi:hypothetical protein
LVVAQEVVAEILAVAVAQVDLEQVLDIQSRQQLLTQLQLVLAEQMEILLLMHQMVLFQLLR